MSVITPKSRGNVINYEAGSSIITYTSIRDWVSLTIINDALLNNLRFTVNGIQVTVKAGEVFDDNFEEFRSISIDTNTSYRMVLRG